MRQGVVDLPMRIMIIMLFVIVVGGVIGLLFFGEEIRRFMWGGDYDYNEGRFDLLNDNSSKEENNKTMEKEVEENSEKVEDNKNSIKDEKNEKEDNGILKGIIINNTSGERKVVYGNYS